MNLSNSGYLVFRADPTAYKTFSEQHPLHRPYPSKWNTHICKAARTIYQIAARMLCDFPHAMPLSSLSC